MSVYGLFMSAGAQMNVKIALQGFHRIPQEPAATLRLPAVLSLVASYGVFSSCSANRRLLTSQIERTTAYVGPTESYRELGIRTGLIDLSISHCKVNSSFFEKSKTAGVWTDFTEDVGLPIIAKPRGDLTCPDWMNFGTALAA